MIRSLLKLAFFLILAILVYNRFFGTDEEKQQSKKIFGEMRSLVVSVSQLVGSERAKFDAGKYDSALAKLGQAYETIRGRAKYIDENVLTRLDDLEQRRTKLQQELDDLEQRENAPLPKPAPPKKGVRSTQTQEQLQAAKQADLSRRREQLQRQMDALLRDSDALLKEAGDKVE